MDPSLEGRRLSGEQLALLIGLACRHQNGLLGGDLTISGIRRPPFCAAAPSRAAQGPAPVGLSLPRPSTWPSSPSTGKAHEM